MVLIRNVQGGPSVNLGGSDPVGVFNQDSGFTILKDSRSTLNAATTDAAAMAFWDDKDMAWVTEGWIRLTTDADGDGSNKHAFLFTFDHTQVDAGHAPLEINSWSSTGLSHWYLKFRYKLNGTWHFDPAQPNPGMKTFLMLRTNTERIYNRMQGGSDNDHTTSDYQIDFLSYNSADLSHKWLAAANLNRWVLFEVEVIAATADPGNNGQINTYIDGVLDTSLTGQAIGNGVLTAAQFCSSINNLTADATMMVRDIIVFK